MNPAAAFYLTVEGVKTVKYFLKAFQVMGIVSNWAAAAMVDGKVTATEGLGLLQQLSGVLGLRMEWDIDDDNNPFIPPKG